MEQEKLKKILVIVTVLVLFGGTCYYYDYNKMANNQSKIVAQGEIQKQEPVKIVTHIIKAEDKPQTKIETKTKKSPIPEPQKIINKKLKPTGKSDLLALAGSSSGKNDPFSCSESKYIPVSDTTSPNAASLPGSLPPVPSGGRIGNLPSLPGLPNINTAGSIGLAPPPAPKPEDLVEIKGFIGNKVIAEVDGVVESLSENEKISSVKVLAVNPSTFTAEFQIKGKTVTKTMKSLNN